MKGAASDRYHGVCADRTLGEVGPNSQGRMDSSLGSLNFLADNKQDKKDSPVADPDPSWRIWKKDPNPSLFL